jgi:hypothetical protein
LIAVGLADDDFAHASPANDPPFMAYHDAAQHAGDTGHAGDSNDLDYLEARRSRPVLTPAARAAHTTPPTRHSRLTRCVSTIRAV